MEIPPGSKVIYYELVGSPLQSKLAVPPAGSVLKFPLPTSGTFPTYSLRAMFAVYLSWVLPTLPWHHGRSQLWCEAKCYNKVEITVEVLVGLGIYVDSILPLFDVIGVLKSLVTPTLWGLINFLNKDLLPSPNLVSSEPHIIADFNEDFPSWGGLEIW